MPNAAVVRSGSAARGAMCTASTRAGEAPTARAASTCGSVAARNASARVSRAMCGHCVSAMAKATSPSDADEVQPLDRQQQGSVGNRSAASTRTAEHEVDPPPRRRHHADEQAHHYIERHGERPDDDGHARAVNETRQHVAAAIVGAEPMRARRRLEHARDAARMLRVGRERHRRAQRPIVRPSLVIHLRQRRRMGETRQEVAPALWTAGQRQIRRQQIGAERDQR